MLPAIYGIPYGLEVKFPFLNTVLPFVCRRRRSLTFTTTMFLKLKRQFKLSIRVTNYIFIRKAVQLKSKLQRPLEPDRSQHDRPTIYVIAQQYPSANLLLITFSFTQEISSRTSKMSLFQVFFYCI